LLFTKSIHSREAVSAFNTLARLVPWLACEVLIFLTAN
jgi:hypothetical protein